MPVGRNNGKDDDEMPLPSSSGVSAVYDHKKDPPMNVSQHPDGGYYGHNGKFDFQRPDASSTRQQLKKWGYNKHIGWEKED